MDVPFSNCVTNQVNSRDLYHAHLYQEHKLADECHDTIYI